MTSGLIYVITGDDADLITLTKDSGDIVTGMVTKQALNVNKKLDTATKKLDCVLNFV